jgi:hypothetical protein
MAWSYDGSDLGTSTTSGRLNSVRLLLGDTDTNDQQVQNEEVIFALGQSGNNIYYAAAWCARTIASQYARKVNTSLDGALSADYSDLSKQYTALADNLEYQGKKAGATIGVLAGGISKTTVDAVRSNTDRIKPSFRRDGFRNPPSYSGDEYDN